MLCTSASSGTSGSSGTAGTAGLTGTAGTSGANGAVGGYLGSFYDTTSQTGLAGTVLTMGLNNSDSWNSGVSIVSGNQITIANPVKKNKSPTGVAPFLFLLKW